MHLKRGDRRPESEERLQSTVGSLSVCEHIVCRKITKKNLKMFRFASHGLRVEKKSSLECSNVRLFDCSKWPAIAEQ